jgi:aromatic ring-opening dioxygenase LigB subunit
MLELCCVSPHPPILVPEVGGRDVERVKDSADALSRLASEISAIEPETLVVMSPHSPIFTDAFLIRSEREMSGSFRQFGAPHVSIQARPDEELAAALRDYARDRGIPVAGGPRDAIARSVDLDHGVLVPLYFLGPRSYRLVCVGISLLDYWDHYQMGLALREAAESLGRKTVFVASGDLSHRLLPGAPAGYDPRAKDFDLSIVEIFRSGEFSELFDLDAGLIEDAGECGLRSLFALSGTVDGYRVKSEVLSYEGPFGVGYMVARVMSDGEDPSRRISPR